MYGWMDGLMLFSPAPELLDKCNSYLVFKSSYVIVWWESQKERDHWEDQDVGGWTILKWILER
jgi:hypothetical protein